MSKKSTINGNIGKQPVLSKLTRKDGSSVSVCNFSIASTDYKRIIDDAGNASFEQVGETAWVDCCYWGDKAETLIKNLQKGMPVIVSGTETLRKNEKDGQVYINCVLDVENISLNLLSTRVEEIKLRPAKESESPDNGNPPL